ncbi:hypothetical protein BB561_000598 [Smittium simulii]|uniref:Actin n=1 Tax=Smittium simulii TaxID=133385 RepID=A0A2T9YYL6_9FUNG|nr:hypothetical protein BB561_000598 [Smittium simulii]
MPIYGGDEVNAIVIDIGSDWTRAGFSGEDSPCAYFPTRVGYIPPKEGLKNDSVTQVEASLQEKDDLDSKMEIDSTNSSSEQDLRTKNSNATLAATKSNISKKPNKKCFVGNMGIEVFRPNMEIQNVLKDGLIENWDAYEEIVEYSLSDCLHVNSEEQPIIFSEANWNTVEKREKLTELIFEKFNVPGFFLSKSAVLSAFGTGKSTALVVDSGSQVTSVVPVYDGYVLQKGIVKQNIAGDYISELIEASLKKEYNYVPTPLFEIKSKQIVDTGSLPNFERRNLLGVTDSYRREMRKKCLLELKESVYQVLNVSFDRDTADNFGAKPFEFSDGFNVSIFGERYHTPEVMFQPQLFESTKSVVKDGEPLSIQEMAQLSVSKCDVDLKPHLLHNVVLSGGNTLFPGFTERFSNELPKMCPSVII